MDQRRLEVLVETHASQQESIANRILQLLIGLWSPFSWWHRPDMVEAWSAESSRIVDEGLKESRRRARAYMTEVLREMDALPPSMPEIEYTYPRGKTRLLDVYKRPARQYEYRDYLQLREGGAGSLLEDSPRAIPRDTPMALNSDAWNGFMRRLSDIVEEDVALVSRDETFKVGNASPTTVGWRRIIHPELSRTGTCGLCIVAANRFYTKDDLLPLHDHCKCTVLPITSDADPGLRLNADDLKRFYEDAGGTTDGGALRQTRYKVVMHGEQGPKLVPSDTHFRDAEDVNRDAGHELVSAWERKTPEAERAMWSAMLEHSQEMSSILADALIEGTDTLKNVGGRGRDVSVADIEVAMQYHARLIAYARSRVA